MLASWPNVRAIPSSLPSRYSTLLSAKPYVERHNLTMRMGMRRFTRLTNGFSKKFGNHAAMVAIHAVYYNFARIHKTLRITPGMAAGLSDHPWTLEEITLMAYSYMPNPAKRGPDKKSAAEYMGACPT